MKNKGIVIALAITVTVLCFYYLSFTLKSINIRNEAIAYARTIDGVIDLDKKQQFLDSLWNLPVLNMLGTQYLYKEVKDNELSLGLDLQGGMHVILEVSPVDILRSLSNNNTDSGFIKAISTARRVQRETGEPFTELFFRIYKKAHPEKKLASLFSNPITKGKISSEATDHEVMAMMNAEVENAVERSFTILRNRLDQFGTSSPNIQRLPGRGQIQIEIPGADNPERVRKLLQGVARLEFYDVMDQQTVYNSLAAINAYLLTQQKEAIRRSASKGNDKDLSELLGDRKNKSDSAAASGLDSLSNQAQSPIFNLAEGWLRYDTKDTASINAIFNMEQVKKLLPANARPLWSHKPEVVENSEIIELNFLEIPRSGKSKLTGEVVTDARHSLDETAHHSVSMTMNATGTRIWKNWTAEASSKSPRGRIAIVLDNEVYCAPSVNGEIPNGNSQITGQFSEEEATDLANVLRAGSLPVPTTIVEEAIIGPSLGEVASNQGLMSIAVGLGLVILFMIVYYGKSGAIANIALLFNLFFILGILAQLDASLTLPGIAGIVLTMGMAVDANVIIYERIREELRNEKRLREAIAIGFQKSFWTIFDANITTFLTAFMLYYFGQGPIKGFAITLMVGIVTTFFTAVYVSRVIIETIVSRSEDETRLSFKTAFSKVGFIRKSIQFVDKRRVAYIFSSIVIGAGVALIVTQGLNFGVDFKGGRSFIVSFKKPVVATDLKIDLTKTFQNAGTEVKNYGGNDVIKVTTSFMVDEDSNEADEAVRLALVKGLESSTGLRYADAGTGIDNETFSISSSTKVGATIADDITASAIRAGLFSIIIIFLYILVRFQKWQFSTGAIIALVHDSLFIFAAFAIARVLGIAFEIDQVFIAALLSVIGYSINDTVIIFDRIREFLNFSTNHNRAEVFNQAINSTLNRTLITSGTTLLVALCLLLFGGETLHGFAFALLVGIGIGTYSSVFIAAPVVLDLESQSSANFLRKKQLQRL